MKFDAALIWHDLEQIRATAPLIHNITNYVVMNSTANALLALGASPVMAHASAEVEEMAQLAAALLLNIGTLSPAWIEAMHKAAAVARARAIPIVLDPVGAGATTMRTDTAQQLIQQHPPTVIRGNASEIMALQQAGVGAKGVDSQHDSQAALTAARQLAAQHNCVVSVSGATDYTVTATATIATYNGAAMMPRVTGFGCTASALVAAFSAVNPDPLYATAAAMALMGICGELAAADSKGPGQLQLNFIDTLYNISLSEIATHLRAEEL